MTKHVKSNFRYLLPDRFMLYLSAVMITLRTKTHLFNVPFTIFIWLLKIFIEQGVDEQKGYTQWARIY